MWRQRVMRRLAAKAAALQLTRMAAARKRRNGGAAGVNQRSIAGAKSIARIKRWRHRQRK